MSNPTSDELAANLSRQIAETAHSMEQTTLAMRKMRARVLGCTIDELVRIDNRTALIVAIVKEHDLSFKDAEAYVDDMEQMAREDAQREMILNEEKRERSEARVEEMREDASLRHE